MSGTRPSADQFHSDDDVEAVVAFVESVSAISRVWIGDSDLVSEVSFSLSDTCFINFRIGRCHALEQVRR